MIDNILNEAKADTRTPWSAAEFETLLRGKSTSYHIHHPFHVMMAQGKLNDQGEMIAAEVLAKHDENYMPPEAQHALDKAAQARAAQSVKP